MAGELASYFYRRNFLCCPNVPISDAMRFACSWLGGEYGNYRIQCPSDITVIFDADERTLSWESNGNLKENAYRNIPEDLELFLHASVTGKAKFEIRECSWAAVGAGADAQAEQLLPTDPFERLALLGVVGETVSALNDGRSLPPPFQVTLSTSNTDRQWAAYARAYFVAVNSKTPLPPLPTGFAHTSSSEPGWGQPEDVAMLNFLGSKDIKGSVATLEELPLTELAEKLKAPAYRVLEGRAEVVLRRAKLLKRFGPLLVKLLPLMGMDSWYACRDVIPVDLKHKLLQPLLSKAKQPNSARPGVRIDRSLAAGMGPTSTGSSEADSGGASSGYNEDDSILYQVYEQLGDFAERPDSAFPYNR